MSVVTLSRGDNGKTIEAQTGDSIVVRLDENPTTGFVWAIDKGNDEILPLQNSDYAMAPGVGVGGGGQRTFTFKAQKAGTVSLQLKLWREWEGDQSITERFAVTIQVRG
jgi:inhibitor of cysteine peptidase